MLERNLAALARRDPSMAERIGWPVETRALARGDDGTWQVRVGERLLTLEVSAAETTRLLAEARAAGPDARVLLFGVGAGELVAPLLAARPDLTIWDRDPAMLRLALARADFSADLASGRLRVALGVDLLTLGADVVVAHPLLERLYRHERLLLGAAAGPPVFVCAGALFVDDLSDALRGLGHAVYTLDVAGLSLDELTLSVAAVKPAFVAAINYTEGLAEFCADAGVPLIVWEIDPTLERLRPLERPAPRTRVFTYRRAHVAEYHAAGFTEARYLPLAANPERRRPPLLTPAEAAPYQVPVAFVGASLRDRVPRLRGDFAHAHATVTGAPEPVGLRLLDELLAEQRRDFTGYVVPELLLLRAPALRAAGKQPGALDAEQVAGELAAGEKRVAVLRALAAAGVEVHVWGDPGWADDGGALHYRGRAGHFVELDRIYGCAQINVDVGRLYQMDIVTMRVFDVLACGGFLLAERSDALVELFTPGVHLDVFSDTEELVAKVRHYLARPDERARLAAAGRAHVVAEHTIAQRVRCMLAELPMGTPQVTP